MIVLQVKGQIRSGKNHMMIDPRSGRHFPNRSWAKWRDEVVKDINKQLEDHETLMRPMLDMPVKAEIHYWKGDLRRRDVPGMIDAIWHCLERALIVKDDCLIVDVDWKDMGLDRANAQARIFLTQIGEK